MIDLEDVANLCPGLRPESAAPLAFRAVIALQRRHRPGVPLTGTLRREQLHEVLKWEERPPDLAAMEDFNRTTEEGAEALALALAGRRCGWTVKRRLQARLSEGAQAARWPKGTARAACVVRFVEPEALFWSDHGS